MSEQIVHRPNQYGGRLVYLRDHVTDAKAWDELWHGSESEPAYRRAEQGHVARHLERLLLSRLSPRARILEAGCGPATFTVGAHARGYRAEGVDYAPDVISRLRARYPAIHFFAGDVRGLEVESDSYDAVYSPGVCEHFEAGPEAVLVEAHRICRRRGIVLVSAPCFNRLRRLLAAAGTFQAAATGHFYQYAFTPREVSAVLEKIGFDVVEISWLSVLHTLESQWPGLRGRLPGRARAPISALLDLVPGLRDSGHACLWVAKKR